jgi:hypothetical protein
MLWMPALAATLLAEAVPAAASERPITVQVGGGVRSFNRELGLGDDFCAGIRMGLGITDRASIGLDFLYSAPVRISTNRTASISALRAVARLDLLVGATRPYVFGGVGGVSMNFNDAHDSSGGTLTGGLGVSRSIGRSHFVSLEGSADLYASRVEYYDLEGRVIYVGPRTFQALKTVAVNVGVRF